MAYTEVIPSSYTSACEEDAVLIYLDFSLQQLARSLINSVTAQGETEYSSIESAMEVSKFLIDRNEDVAKFITESKYVWKNEKLRCFLVDLYHDSITETLNVQGSRTFQGLRLHTVEKKSSGIKESSFFMSFRGEELRYSFGSHLTDALEMHNINSYNDYHISWGRELKTVLLRIEQSQIALVIFSSRYGDSRCCMDVLVKIMKRVDEGKLRVIPIYYKVKVRDVREQKGEFGENFRKLAKHSTTDQINNWKEALESISKRMSFSLKDERYTLTQKKRKDERSSIMPMAYTEANLISYISACEKDAVLKSLAFSLQQQARKLINSLTAQGNTEYSSIDSVMEVSKFLIDRNEDVAKIITESKEDVWKIIVEFEEAECWKKEEQRCFVFLYLGSTINTLNLLNTVEKCIGKAESIDLTIRVKTLFKKQKSLLEDLCNQKTKLKKVKFWRIFSDGVTAASQIALSMVNGPTKMNTIMFSPINPPLVFVSFRGQDVRHSFVSHLTDALERHKINVFIDDYELRGSKLTNLFVRIEQSQIALVIFSSRYGDSKWCMNELVKIMKCVDEGKLHVIPIFYKVSVGDIRYQKGEFGENFQKLAEHSTEDQIKTWKEALESFTNLMGLSLKDESPEADFMKKIVEEVQKVQKKKSFKGK